MSRLVRNSAYLIAFALLTFGAAPVSRHVTLPTEWSLMSPPAQIATVGTLPESARLTADGAHLIVTEGGQAGAGISFLAPDTLTVKDHLDLKGVFGDVAIDSQGDGFWAATAGGDSVVHIFASRGIVDRVIDLPHGFWASAVAPSSDGKTLAASGDQLDEVALIDLAGGTVATVPAGHHPAGLAFSRDGRTLYVADWGERALSVIDVAARQRRASIPVGDHPETLLLSRDGKRLYVSETDDDSVGIIDTSRNIRSGGVNVGIYGGLLYGASPTAMAFSPGGTHLYVVDSASNAVIVLRIGGEALPHLIGAIPTGWYPTAVAVTRDAIYIANGMGEGSRANPQFQPFAHEERSGYVAASMVGSVRRISKLSDAELARGLTLARALAGPFLRAALASKKARRYGPAADYTEARTVVRANGPIRHVIYIIKENRTYDQVLGDIPGADGDAKLTMFGERVTPNEHAIARRFGVFDMTFCDAEVSADGHNWSTAAFGNDYLEKTWPPNYGGRRKGYDFEDGADASVPHSGYVWDDAVRSHVSLRDYGEFVTNPEHGSKEATTHMPDLVGLIDPHFIGFDTNYRDEDREAEWAREFAAYVKNGNLPALEIVRLPNDHTAGTYPGRRSPQAMVAENDLAIGRLVDAVSHSPYWKSTAIFSIEDDAQNGPDHVDDQRTTFYLASPYAKGGVRHDPYSTAGILRTIEIILGMPPMSAYDASARPMYDAFRAKPDLRPFDVLPEQVDVEARNGLGAYRARDSTRMDFSRADAAPPAELNDILAHASEATR